MVHRTALITAGSIAAVVFAGAIAVGANLGILNVADSRPVGKLSAATTPAPTGSTKMVATKVANKPTKHSQKYIIKKAGTVSVTASGSGLRLLDVSAKGKWKWTLAQTTDRKLTVTFKLHSSTYTFIAVLGKHGTILAKVDHPITKVVSSPPSAAVVAYTPPTYAAPAPAPAPTHSGGEPGDGGGGSDD
jgi:hypothetical protein